MVIEYCLYAFLLKREEGKIDPEIKDLPCLENFWTLDVYIFFDLLDFYWTNGHFKNRKIKKLNNKRIKNKVK